MKAIIITVGDEILRGDILNTNSKDLAEYLVGFGIDTEKIVSVSDNKALIIKELEDLSYDFYFLVGGLGPTDDDVTREALAEFLQKDLVVHEESKRRLIKFLKDIDIKITDNNYKQVNQIRGSHVFINKWGNAPGEFVEENGRKYFLFPGPPSEFIPMVSEYLGGYLNGDTHILTESLNLIRKGEAEIESALRKIDFHKDVSINTFAHFHSTEVKIVVKNKDIHEGKKILADAIKKLYDYFGSNIYSTGNTTPAEALLRNLKENNMRISFAESITGGLLASTLTKFGGASQVLKESYVTYSNESKMYNLGVKKETLEKLGAVSMECAFEMAEGLFAKGMCDVAVSVTGEAGPTSSERPVGEVYYCIYFGKDDYILNRLNLKGNRREIQKRVMNLIFSDLLLFRRNSWKTKKAEA